MRNKVRIGIYVVASALFLFAVLAVVDVYLANNAFKRVSFAAPAPSSQAWDEVFSKPKPVSIRTCFTGNIQTDLSSLINLKHPGASALKNKKLSVPVLVNILQRGGNNNYLIDTGLDAMYQINGYGSTRGILKTMLTSKGEQGAGQDIVSLLWLKNIVLEGVFFSSLRFSHTAGVLQLPQNIRFIAGADERYKNYKFLSAGGHLDKIKFLETMDFTKAGDMPPFGPCIDVFGDGSFWAISTPGRSKGNVSYLANGVDGAVLLTGDACMSKYGLEHITGPGCCSSDVKQAQKSLEQIAEFLKLYPSVKAVFGHEATDYPLEGLQ